MAKKTFVSRARVVTGKRWYIEYYAFDPSSGENRRFRQDFDLNSIPDEQVRKAVADQLVSRIDLFASVEIPEQVQKQDFVALGTAVTDAIAVKLESPRKNTHKGYRSIGNTFLTWCRQTARDVKPCTDFTKKDARAFMDMLKSRRKYRQTTIKNYINHLRALWSEMAEVELVRENPWKSIKFGMNEEKLRRPFTAEERKIVAEYIEQRDYWLFRALLLQFFCYIRPVELTRIKGKSFDFTRGIVKIEMYEAKKWKTRWATIPKTVLHYFTDGVFNKCPANQYQFGLVKHKKGDWTIGPSNEQLADDRMYKRHRKYLQFLLDENKLKDISGLSWYSWKDTGISLHAGATSPLSTRDQAGHTDFDQTLAYYQQDPVNKEYQNLKNDLF